MLEVLQQDYVRTARAKGLRERLVVYRHALSNTLVPLLTSIGIIFGGLLSGTFVVETIFNIPGLGSLAIESIFARDYPVTMSIVLLFTVLLRRHQPRRRPALRRRSTRASAIVGDGEAAMTLRSRFAAAAPIARDFWRRARRSPNIVIGGTIVVVVVAVASVGPLFAPYDPTEVDMLSVWAAPGGRPPARRRRARPRHPEPPRPRRARLAAHRRLGAGDHADGRHHARHVRRLFRRLDRRRHHAHRRPRLRLPRDHLRHPRRRHARRRHADGDHRPVAGLVAGHCAAGALARADAPLGDVHRGGDRLRHADAIASCIAISCPTSSRR